MSKVYVVNGDTFCREYFAHIDNTPEANRMSLGVGEWFDLFGFYVEADYAMFHHLMKTLDDITCTDLARMTGMI